MSLPMYAKYFAALNLQHSIYSWIKMDISVFDYINSSLKSTVVNPTYISLSLQSYVLYDFLIVQKNPRTGKSLEGNQRETPEE